MHVTPPESSTSALGQIDPRTRIIGALLLSAAAALSPDLQSALVAAGCAGALSAVMVRPFSKLITRLFAINVFLALLWLTLPFSTPGREIFWLGPLAATREGLSVALLVTVKANGAALVMIALLGAVSPLALARGMRALGAPGKLALLFALTARYLGLVFEEHEKVKRAMLSRGFSPKMKLRDYKTLAHGAALSFLRGADQAEHIRRAMLCRGFTGATPAVGSLRFSRIDAVFSMAALGMLALTVFAGFYGS